MPKKEDRKNKAVKKKERAVKEMKEAFDALLKTEGDNQKEKLKAYKAYNKVAKISNEFAAQLIEENQHYKHLLHVILDRQAQAPARAKSDKSNTMSSALLKSGMFGKDKESQRAQKYAAYREKRAKGGNPHRVEKREALAGRTSP